MIIVSHSGVSSRLQTSPGPGPPLPMKEPQSVSLGRNNFRQTEQRKPGKLLRIFIRFHCATDTPLAVAAEAGVALQGTLIEWTSQRRCGAWGPQGEDAANKDECCHERPYLRCSEAGGLLVTF